MQSIPALFLLFYICRASLVGEEKNKMQSFFLSHIWGHSACVCVCVCGTWQSLFSSETISYGGKLKKRKQERKKEEEQTMKKERKERRIQRESKSIHPSLCLCLSVCLFLSSFLFLLILCARLLSPSPLSLRVFLSSFFSLSDPFFFFFFFFCLLHYHYYEL